MNGTFDLRTGERLELDGRYLSVARGTNGQDEVTLECEDRPARLQVADLHGSDDEVVYQCDRSDRYCILASHSGKAVLRIDLEVCSLEEVARLDRPVVMGYDPGGLEWVKFIESPSGLALVTESSAMLFDDQGALLWHRHHGALGASVSLSPDGILVLEDDAGDFGYRLGDGSVVRFSRGDQSGTAGGENPV